MNDKEIAEQGNDRQLAVSTAGLPACPFPLSSARWRRAVRDSLAGYLPNHE